MIYTERESISSEENVVSKKMDFNVTKCNSAKIWISNDQDLKVACETLGKLTLGLRIEMEKLKAQKGME